MKGRQIIDRLNRMLESAHYNEIDDLLAIGPLIEDINEDLLLCDKLTLEDGFYSVGLTHKKSKQFYYEAVKIENGTTSDNFDCALRFKGYDLNKFTYTVINKI